jgi:5-methylcytosine-specific restriction endonuclease McrA
VPHEVRRAVLERDGLRCTWQSPDGVRCENRAWLELDHIHPRGQGGTNHPANIRIFCRPHNQLAAERAYGKATIADLIARRRAQPNPKSSATPR